MERLLAAGGGPGEVRLGDDGELIIPRLDADIVPAEADALREELSAVIPRLPMTQHFGDGTLSSSDGQRFPLRGKSLTGRHLSRYFGRGQGFTTYTHVSDQHSTYATKVIMAYAPEAHYTLDGILGNITDLPIAEQITDARILLQAGQTQAAVAGKYGVSRWTLRRALRRPAPSDHR